MYWICGGPRLGVDKTGGSLVLGLAYMITGPPLYLHSAIVIHPPLVLGYPPSRCFRGSTRMIDHATAEVGVRRAFIIEGRESKKKAPPNLGFAQINYGRLFVRDYWTLFAIARELECSVSDLVSGTNEQRSGPRWSELIQSSEEILETVRTLPHPSRQVVILRGSGLSWRKISAAHPDRDVRSMKDDHRDGIGTLLRFVHDHLNFLASAEKFFVVKSAEAA